MCVVGFCVFLFLGNSYLRLRRTMAEVEAVSSMSVSSVSSSEKRLAVDVSGMEGNGGESLRVRFFVGE